MESEKVKEIKEKLQEEIFIANSFGDKLRRVPTKELQNLLTLINELESEKEKLGKQCVDWNNLYHKKLDQNQQLKLENERLKESCKNCHYIKDLEISNGHAKELKDRIAELEKENAKLLDSVETVQSNRCTTKCELTKKELKQFAQRLKEMLEENSPIAGYDLEDLEFDGETIQECIDETLKEFINKGESEK